MGGPTQFALLGETTTLEDEFCTAHCDLHEEETGLPLIGTDRRDVEHEIRREVEALVVDD
jgi:hypothetical protein